MLQGHKLPHLDILFQMFSLDLFKISNVDVCMPDMNRFLRHFKTIFWTSHIVKTINRCITHNNKQALHDILIDDKKCVQGWLILMCHGNGKRGAMCYRNEAARCIKELYCGEYLGYHIMPQKFALEVKPVNSRSRIWKWRHSAYPGGQLS